jgi:hypothetical protein
METTQHEFEQSIALAEMLADELKASLEVLQVATSARRPRYDNLLHVEVDSTSIKKAQGNLAAQVSRGLKPGDLLLLTASTRRIGQPILGKAPEAIARRHPDVSMIVIHFPRLD